MENKFETLMVEQDAAVATIYLNRPGVRNAFSEKMLHELLTCFAEIKEDSSVRAVIITGKGDAFCAGMDLNWMQDVMQYTFDENVEDSLILSDMYQAVHECPCPVIARVNGPAMGGGTGLVAACDISVGTEKSFFGLRETKLGLIPAVVYPYLHCKIESSSLREAFLTGERFSGEYAREIGLLNRCVPEAELDEEVKRLLDELLSGAPIALREAKKLLNQHFQCWKGEKQIVLAELIARMRMSEEGQEGMKAFLEKRKPIWEHDKGKE